MHWFFYNCITNQESYKAAVISLDLDKFELFGDEYFFEHLRQYSVERAYKLYITDCLKMIAENTAKQWGGSSPSMRFIEVIEPKPVKKPKSAEEIIEDVNKRCGLIMIDTEEGETE